MDQLPDELLVKVFSYLDKRDLCKCSQVCKRWNTLSYSNSFWSEFSLTEINKWCASSLVSVENTRFLIECRFSSRITRVDLAKMCFSFDTLDTLFRHCPHIKSLVINFKYLQIRPPNHVLDDQCIKHWPENKLEKLYLKNVCDAKTRRFNSRMNMAANGSATHHQTSYDIIELEIIKLIRALFTRNSQSLQVLGLKCVDPTIISSCVNYFENLQILLLNNINDADSVLQEISYVCKKIKCIELTKCRDFDGDGLQELIEQCSSLETLQLGKYIYPTLTELNEINWTNLKFQLRELSISTKFPVGDSSSCSSSNSSSNSSYSSSSSYESNLVSSSINLYSSTIFNYLNDENNLEYLALEDFTLRFPFEDRQSANTRRILVERRRRGITLNMNLEGVQVQEDDDQIDDSEPKLKKSRANVETSPSHLKFLYLRNIRNLKQLSHFQLNSLKTFLNLQINLHTLDLIGLYLGSQFLCSVLSGLNNLRYELIFLLNFVLF